MDNCSLHVMFDVDGTLVQSYEFDEQCYLQAVLEVLGEPLYSDWDSYTHVTDSGILDHHLKLIGLFDKSTEIHSQVKNTFINKIKQRISAYPVKEIPGASSFINKLKTIGSISISIATGGWLETAMLKLDAAGIDISDIPIASSNDHFSRAEIMKISSAKSNIRPNHNITYFGDALWDKNACEELGYNFILVGSKTSHRQKIIDFTSVNKSMSFIGL